MEWGERSKKEVLETLKSSLDGLSNIQAQERLRKNGPNTVLAFEKPRYYHFLLLHFRSFIPWVLLLLSIMAFIAAYAFDVQSHYFDAFVMIIIFVFNATMSSYQEYKSYEQAYKLDIVRLPEAVVIREKKTLRIPSQDVVVGDILILSSGMKVPADARLLEANGLEVDESAISGESLSVIKSDSPSIAQNQSHNQTMVFKGTYISNGEGLAVVIATGKFTVSGKMASPSKIQKISPFKHEIDLVFNNIFVIAGGLILIAVLLLSFAELPWTEVVLMAVALLISAIPESLPTIVLFSVANSAKRLLGKSVLVKRNMLIETLGSIDVVCLDKTGTLTMNRLLVSHAYIGGRVTSYENLTTVEKDFFSKACLLANEATSTNKGFVGEPVDIALIDYFNSKGLDIVDLQQQHKRMSLKPFNSKSLVVSSVHSVDGKNITYSKGAPEKILLQCGFILVKGRLFALTTRRREEIEQKLHEFSDMALRNVAFSYSSSGKDVFVGFVGLTDTPKKDIDKTITKLYDAHIEVKMMTGDSRQTSLALASLCGFRNAKAIDWVELRNLSVGEFAKAVEEYTIFCRLSADNKLAIVKALQENGHSVAVTGDGINDVPAFREAEVGIAIGSKCADMTRDNADVVILNDDIEAVVSGVKEGRTIFHNVRKVVNYLLTANMGEIILVFIGSLFGVAPFLAIQLLWVNFVTNYGPALALGLDPPPSKIMTKKPTGKKEKILNKQLLILTLYISLKKIILLGGLFIWAYTTTGDLIFAQTIAFTWLVLWHFVRVATIKFEEKTSLYKNKHLVMSIIIPILAQLIILYTPISVFFRVVPLSAMVWAVLIVSLLAAIYLERGISLFVQRIVPFKEDEY